MLRTSPTILKNSCKVTWSVKQSKLVRESFRRAFSTSVSPKPAVTRVAQGTTGLPATTTFPDEIFPDRAEVTMAGKIPKIDFLNTKQAYKSKSTFNLVRTLVILRICGIRIIVDNADMLLRLARRVFSDHIVIPVVKYTFFAHFCAGEDSVTIKPTIDYLKSYNVGPILDYAAESDLTDIPHPDTSSTSGASSRYDAPTEALCDASVKTFMRCIDAVSKVSQDGFAAIKFTALSNPILLKRVTTLLDMYLAAFPQPTTSGPVLMDEIMFGDFVKSKFNLDDITSSVLFKKMDIDGDGFISVFDWNMALTSAEMISLTRNGSPSLLPAYLASTSISSLFDEEDEIALERLNSRVRKVISAAVPTNVKIMVDAEHQYFQTCIDRAVLDLQQEFNREQEVVWGTYQCYLRTTPHRLDMELSRSTLLGYLWGAKLVRGAYMEHERAESAKNGVPSPIFDDIESTHASYNWCAQHVLEYGPHTRMMIASHNQRTDEFLVEKMSELGIAPDQGRVYFGQLLGMADHLTFSLGQNGYGAYKYVPFGKVEEVIPYLLRRARENSNMLGGVGKERAMLWKELKRRFGF